MVRLLSLPTFLAYQLNRNSLKAEALTMQQQQQQQQQQLLQPNGIAVQDCFGKICKPIEEFCYTFSEDCRKCSDICSQTSHNYKEEDCLRECSDYVVLQSFRDDIHTIQQQQNLFLNLLIVLIILISARYIYQFIRWLIYKRCMKRFVHKIFRHQHKPTQNGKDGGIGGTTIQNMGAINENERAPSQIYSINGVEGSVLTMTTPISTRYPAENTTPTSLPTTEYSYVNQALAVTPTTPAVV